MFLFTWKLFGHQSLFTTYARLINEGCFSLQKMPNKKPQHITRPTAQLGLTDKLDIHENYHREHMHFV